MNGIVDKCNHAEEPEEKGHTHKSESLALSKWHGNYKYNRVLYESLTNLQNAISYRYGWTCRKLINSLITSSGMAAISTVLHNILIESQFASDNINVIHGDELYEDSPELIQYLHKTYRCRFNIHSIDVTDTDSILKLFHSDSVKNKINILYIETCSNPSGYILDLSIISKLQSLSNHLYVVMDNTWCSSLIFNPFDHLQSTKKMSSSKVSPLTVIAVTSLSKYYSGGSCIGGAIVSDDEAFMSATEQWISMHGHHFSPVHCELVLKNINLMKDRIPKTSAMTINVARFLKEFNDDIVVDVKYPLLEDHVSYEMARKYLKGKDGIQYGPSVLYFKVALQVKTEDDAWDCIKQWERNNLGFVVKTSYGGKDTRFDQVDNNVDDDGFWVRLAIGFQDEENDIIESLKLLFESLNCQQTIPNEVNTKNEHNGNVSIGADLEKMSEHNGNCAVIGVEVSSGSQSGNRSKSSANLSAAIIAENEIEIDSEK